MKLIPVTLVALAFALAARAECQQTDPVSASPGMYKVLLENDQVRVVEYSVKPGERDQPHTHPPKVSYVASGGSLRITLGDTSFVTNDSTGEVTWRGAVPQHYAANVGSTPVRIVLFEVKRIDGEAASPDQDPARVNPSSITVKLENDSVRVMEAVIPPGFKEKQHTHPPYAMYILTGGNIRMHYPDGTTRDVEMTTGAALFSDKTTHWAENTGSSTIRVLLVELRHP
ncbi:MAG TPA: hypothetical protein VFD22_13945 [Gemmatimonadaceae bacterium]|nr:hypothetical protein [Gemmatimonadaceae bacterium]